MIKNKFVRDYIEYYFSTTDVDKITEENLKEIKDITISCDKEIAKDTLEDILLFPNLEKLMIRNISITEENIEHIKQLKNLKEICFSFCKMKCKKIELNVSKVKFYYCENLDLKNIENPEDIKELTIIGGKKVNIKEIKNFKNIEKLILQNLQLKDLTFIKDIGKTLKYLNLNGTTVKNIENIDSKIEVEWKKQDNKIE